MEEYQNNPLSDLKDEYSFLPYLVDVTREPRPKRFLFEIGGTGFSPLGNIMAIKAKAKNGKTQLTKIMSAAAVSGSCMGISCNIENANVLICDTEQDPDDALRVQQGVLTLCSKTDSRYKYNEPCERLNSLALRNVETAERWPIIKDAIAHFKPQLVVIDGVRDLIADFNDLEQSSVIINELMRVSTEYDCAIWNILHMNKNDENMRGHLGTELVNKVTDVLTTTKNTIGGDTTFVVSQAETRNKDINNFSFAIDDFGIPCKPRMGSASLDELSMKIRKSYEDLKKRHDESATTSQNGRASITLRKADFVDSIMKVCEVGKSKAYELMKQAEEQNIIEWDSVMHTVQMVTPKVEKKDDPKDTGNNNEYPF